MNEEHFPDKELAELWKRQETPMAHAVNLDEVAKLATSVKAKHQAAQRSLLWLNIREVIPAVFLTGLFTVIATVEDSAWVLYLAALLCLSVAVSLVGTTIRQNQAEQHFDTTLRGTIERSLSQAQHRFTMYRTAGWWYVVPLASAVGIFYAWAVFDSPDGAKPSDAIVIVLMLGLFAIVAWWNRRIAFAKWQPEVERLETMLSDMSDDQSNTD